MSLDNFRNRTIIWDTVNKDFPQPIQIMQGDVNARTLLIKIVDNGVEIDLTGHSLKLTYQYTNSSNSGFVMVPPENLTKGEFLLVIPTEMTETGVIEANLILLNKDKEQVIVSKNLTFISDNSTVTDLAQEVNNKIDDFTKLLLENMPQVLRSELNDLHAQTESNKSNIELKANLADMTSLQSAMTELKNEVEAFGISPENLVTIKSLLDAIASNASESEVVELINSVKVLTSNISLMSNGDYSPKANQTDLESLQHTVNDHSATISTKANQTDLDNLQATVDKQGVAISTKAEQSELSITNKNVATAQETANKAESEAKNAMAKATEAQANSLPLNGIAVSAIKLATPRKLQVNLQSSSFQYFDGTADATNIGVSGVLPIANGGTSTSDGVINTTAYANSADGTDGFTTVCPNLNLLNFKSGLIIGQYLSWIDGLTLEKNPARAVFDYVSVTPGATYTINSNWDKTERIAIYAYDSNAGKKATFIYDGSSAKWVPPSAIGRVITQKTTFSIPDGMNFIRVVFFAKDTSAKLTLQDILDAKIKLEPGSIATPWMPSASEVTTADYPKYVGFSNSIKPNKKSSDYNWLPISAKANQTDLENYHEQHKKIETLIKHGIYDYIVDINGTGDFTSVAECVKQAADLSTIYVKNGLYENEIVKAWLKTVFIIGESRDGVIITNSTGEYETPPVEMGTGLLRNLTIYAKDPGGLTPNNKGYALHSEASVYNYYKFEVDNCNIVSDWRQSWGMGMRSDMVYNARNVNFDGGVYFHDNEHSNGTVQRIFFDTCNMTREDTNEALIIQDQQMSNSVIDVRFNRCLVKSLHGNDIAFFKWDAINKNVIPATGFVDFPSWRLNSFSWGNSEATLNA